MGKLLSNVDMRGDGSYTVKKVRGHDYLCLVSYENGKQKWKMIGNLEKLDPKNPHLVKYKAISGSKEIIEPLEKYYAGKLDKKKAKSELMKLLDR